MNTPPDILCSACPTEFSTFLSYAHALHFEDKPDYSYIRKLFCGLFAHEGYHFDHPFAGCTMSNDTDNKSAIIRAGTRSRQRAEWTNSAQYTGRTYVMYSPLQSLLIAACLACVLIVITVNFWYL
jgi:hypothetical protein